MAGANLPPLAPASVTKLRRVPAVVSSLKIVAPVLATFMIILFALRTPPVASTIAPVARGTANEDVREVIPADCHLFIAGKRGRQGDQARGVKRSRGDAVIVAHRVESEQLVTKHRDGANKVTARGTTRGVQGIAQANGKAITQPGRPVHRQRLCSRRVVFRFTVNEAVWLLMVTGPFASVK